MPIERESTDASWLSTNQNQQQQQQQENIAKKIDILRSRLSKFETEHGRLLGLSYQPVDNDEVVITTSPKAGTTWLQQICHQWRCCVAAQQQHQQQHGGNGDGCIVVVGDDQFDEISRVIPWLELAFDQGQGLYAPQYKGGDGTAVVADDDTGSTPFLPTKLRPRMFKTHAWQPHCPQGFAKVIVGIRDPMDVVLSFYYFFRGWFFAIPKQPQPQQDSNSNQEQALDGDDEEDDDLSLTDFVRYFWLARSVPTSKMENASYFVHLISWYQAYIGQQPQQEEVSQCNEEPTTLQPQILFVFYEDLKENLEEQVRRIVSFLSSNEKLPPPWTESSSLSATTTGPDRNEMDNNAIIQFVVERSTFSYMKQHEHLFDEKLSKLARNEACGLPPHAGRQASKLRTGRSSSLTSSFNSSGDCCSYTNSDPEHPWRRYHLQEELPIEIQDEIQEQWKRVVQPVTGCETYADFRQYMKQLQQQ